MSNAQKVSAEKWTIEFGSLSGYHYATGPGDLRIQTNDKSLLDTILSALRAEPTPDAHSEVGVVSFETEMLALMVKHLDKPTLALLTYEHGPYEITKVSNAVMTLLGEVRLTAGVVKDLNEVISSKTREIEPLMPAVTYRTGGIYVAEVKRLIAKAKEQQSALVGGPEGDSILGYTIPTGTWLMLQANIGALIEALTAGAGKAEPVDITDEMVERAIVGYVDALQDVSARLAFSDLATHDRIGTRAALTAALASKPEGER